ncbi:MAG: hypothetical protein OXP07_19370 [Defluviicoccus sp.]|nr:hypothetical protein [Defluviicoccus sp.]
MTPELIAILAVGVALAGVMLQGQHTLGARMDRLDRRMDRLEAKLKEVRDRLSRLEGKMDFLEGHIVRRDDAGAPAE